MKPAPTSSRSIGSRSTSKTIRNGVLRSGRGNSLKPSAFKRASASASVSPGNLEFGSASDIRAMIQWIPYKAYLADQFGCRVLENFPCGTLRYIKVIQTLFKYVQ